MMPQLLHLKKTPMITNTIPDQFHHHILSTMTTRNIWPSPDIIVHKIAALEMSRLCSFYTHLPAAQDTLRDAIVMLQILAMAMYMDILMALGHSEIWAMNILQQMNVRWQERITAVINMRKGKRWGDIQIHSSSKLDAKIFAIEFTSNIFISYK